MYVYLFAIFSAWLAFNILIKIFKITAATALIITAIIVIIIVSNRIDPRDLWRRVTRFSLSIENVERANSFVIIPYIDIDIDGAHKSIFT